MVIKILVFEDKFIIVYSKDYIKSIKNYSKNIYFK